MEKNSLPVVYSCSGCSNVAQMANYIAVQLDRANLASMSCIAGVGGDVKKLVKTAKSATNIIAIDGCPLACAKACLARHGIKPNKHYQLSDRGIKKHDHHDFDLAEAKIILEEIAFNIQGGV